MNRSTLLRLARLERASISARPEPAPDGDEAWNAVVVSLEEMARAKSNGRELSSCQREWLAQMEQKSETGIATSKA